MSARPVLDVVDLTQRFAGRSGATVYAVTGVSLSIAAGETLGLVGESGCGKSTTARAILQSPPPTSGQVVFQGVDLTTVPRTEMRRIRRRMQLVFQDPFSSLNPRWPVVRALMEPAMVDGGGDREAWRRRADELLDLVGLDPRRHGRLRPQQLSGGQCQRVAIARALMLSPDLVVFDEAVSSLDVSIQAQVLNLINQLQRELSLTSLFIAHDLAVVKLVSDRVGVMYLGKLCEIGPAEELYRAPVHPYTAALLSSIPSPDPSSERRQRTILTGDLPSPTAPPSGCAFRTRCPAATERCTHEVPQLRDFGGGHLAACHHPLRTADTAVAVSSPALSV